MEDCDGSPPNVYVSNKVSVPQSMLKNCMTNLIANFHTHRHRHRHTDTQPYNPHKCSEDPPNKALIYCNFFLYLNNRMSCALVFIWHSWRAHAPRSFATSYNQATRFYLEKVIMQFLSSMLQRNLIAAIHRDYNLKVVFLWKF
jgi:hypothetical protein